MLLDVSPLLLDVAPMLLDGDQIVRTKMNVTRVNKMPGARPGIVASQSA
jgi:hypothetical protein